MIGLLWDSPPESEVTIFSDLDFDGHDFHMTLMGVEVDQTAQV